MPKKNNKVTELPVLFKNWFSAKNWQVYPHQLDLIGLAQDKKSCLLVAPTGAGKTLSGFLPSLIELQ